MNPGGNHASLSPFLGSSLCTGFTETSPVSALRSPLLTSLSLTLNYPLPLLSLSFSPLSNGFNLYDPSGWLSVPDSGQRGRAAAGASLPQRGRMGVLHLLPPPLQSPVNLLARLEPATIWSDGLFMEPGGGGPGPDPANLEAISSPGWGAFGVLISWSGRPPSPHTLPPTLPHHPELRPL